MDAVTERNLVLVILVGACVTFPAMLVLHSRLGLLGAAAGVAAGVAAAAVAFGLFSVGAAVVVVSEQGRAVRSDRHPHDLVVGLEGSRQPRERWAVPFGFAQPGPEILERGPVLPDHQPAMAGQGFDPDFIFSWPTGRMGVMEGDSAVQAVFGSQLEKLKKNGESPDEALLAALHPARRAELRSSPRRIRPSRACSLHAERSWMRAI